MIWPFSLFERRESSYTDTLVSILLGTAKGSGALPTATGALEACAGMVGRAFATAEVTPRNNRTEALTPSLLSMIGRALIRNGEIVLFPEVRGGELQLLPVASHDVTGDPDPSTWRYRVNLAGPSKQVTRKDRRAESVIHLKYSCDPETPWRGQGPLTVAKIAGRLSAETVQALADEGASPRGTFLATPHTDGQSATVTALKSDIRKANGSMLLVESMSSGWGAGMNRGAQQDWTPRRFGASPPAALVQAAALASREVMAACGVPPDLFAEKSTGTAGRESWRRLLYSTVGPLGRIVAAELETKLEVDGLAFEWDELRASDLAGRSRAFKQLTEAGVQSADAARICGLTLAEPVANQAGSQQDP